MSNALVWVRKSKGKDDDIGLAVQRETTLELAESLAEDVDKLDLGVHTGFSIHSRDLEDERIDANEDVLDAVSRIESGEYDYLIAYDDTRIARDQYFATIERACLIGDCELCYVADVDEGMSFELQRTVEKHVKQNEIRKSKKARQRRQEKGYWEGRPRWGTQYDSNKEYLEPGKNFDDALLAIRMNKLDEPSYDDILQSTNISSKGTLTNILERAEWYRDLAEEHEVEIPEMSAEVKASREA